MVENKLGTESKKKEVPTQNETTAKGCTIVIGILLFVFLAIIVNLWL